MKLQKIRIEDAANTRTKKQIRLEKCKATTNFQQLFVYQNFHHEIAVNH